MTRKEAKEVSKVILSYARETTSKYLNIVGDHYMENHLE